MLWLRRLFPGFLTRYAAGLRFPNLFLLTLAVFLVDLVVPDFLPLADEVLLGLCTLMLGSLTQRRAAPADTFEPDGSSRRVVDTTAEPD